MPLPAPNLDDRRFQDLVDDAKRLVQRHCPEWTDHNVSDPGVTLIETFAFMVDQLLYRLNRVPDLDYVKFLDLIGVQLFAPTAAHADVTFWLSAPQEEAVKVPVGTPVATRRTDAEEIIFTTVEGLDVVPCSLSALASSSEGGNIRASSGGLRKDESFLCFDKHPKVGDSLLVGLSNPVPRCAVVLRFGCQVEGVGVDPEQPPLAWDAWTGKGWERCELESDGTGGLNKSGDVIVHVPAGHTASVNARRSGGWLRCVIVEADDNQPTYSASPEITRLEAFTIGGTAPTVNAETLEDEVVGESEGVSGQRFTVEHLPVVEGGGAEVLEVAEDDGWVPWRQVKTFASSGPDDRHFMFEKSSGEVVLGPAVRERDGSLRRFGAIPPKGSPLRLRSYRTGGGHRGNVASGALRVLKTSIPYVTRVANRHPATGGVDGETLEAAKIRGPILLRTRDRAVTAEDYEQLAREATPEVARVHCLGAADTEGADAGVVRVLVVPAAPQDELGRLQIEDLVLGDETLARMAEYLDERRVIGTRLVIEPPTYQGVTVLARLRARPLASAERLRHDALTGLYRYFNPIVGGPDGAGWPFGQAVHAGDVYAVLARLPGVGLIDEVLLFKANPITRARIPEAEPRIELGPSSLVFSYKHQVRVEEG